MISASELGAWDFCPRQVYFKRILGIKTEKTEAMVKGTIKHKVFEEVISSHKKTGAFNIGNIIEDTLSRYTEDFETFGTDMDDFRRELGWSFGILWDKISRNEFSVPEFCEEWLESEDLGMRARVDVIFDDSGEWIVGDLKTSTSDFLGTRLQIGAGALLFEKHMNVGVNKIKIISHKNWMEKEIHLTDELRKQILKTRDEIEEMVATKRLPPRCANHNKCNHCNFLETHCNAQMQATKEAREANDPEENNETNETRAGGQNEGKEAKASFWGKLFR